MVYESSAVLFAFGLTLFAGLSTGIDSALAFFAKSTNARFLTASLGFSAGVMIYVSMLEIFVKARDALTAATGPAQGYIITTLAFFGGILLIALIDKLVPSFENPHEVRGVEDMPTEDVEAAKKKTCAAWGFSRPWPLPSIIFRKGSPPLWPCTAWLPAWR